MDPVTAFVYFAFPISVVLLCWGAAKLHERSLTKSDFAEFAESQKRHGGGGPLENQKRHEMSPFGNDVPTFAKSETPRDAKYM